MAAIVKKLYSGYKFLFDEVSDPRTGSWFLMSSPLPGLALLVVYLMFVLKWGPKFMRNRKPYNLNFIMMAYNIFQIVSCSYIFIGGMIIAWGWKYKWICEPVDYSNQPEALKIAAYVHFYFTLKVIDLLDTIFFVLRKKNNQITFLHVYHHTGMVMLTWSGVKFYPGGHGTLVGQLNSFVHIVMYSYYLLTIAYPVYKQSIWWKKYITQLQIFQFLWLVIHFLMLALTPDCAYPRWIAAMFLPQNLFMLILFLDFYRKTYLKPVKKDPSPKENGSKSKNGISKKEKYDDNLNLIEYTETTTLSNTEIKEMGNGLSKSRLQMTNGISNIEESKEK